MSMICHFLVWSASFTFILGDCKGFGLPRKVFNMEHFTKDIMAEGIFKSNRLSSLGGMCKFCHVIVKDDMLELSPKPNEGEEMWLSHIAVNKNKKYV